MGIFGELLSLPVKLANVPFEAAERVFNGGDKVDEEDRVISAPLKILSDTLETFDD